MGYLFKFDPKLFESFLECVFFLIENIDMILTLIHKRKGKRKPHGVGLADESWGLAVYFCPSSQVRVLLGANNSMGPSDLDESHDLTVVHLRETSCREPVHPRD